ncbi:diadenylate cyclase [Bacillus sp. JEM-1]|uniref:tetratricopeptide repeat protein n=1 Tax=Bacillus sp. JEM-1 TaxID=1977090 RepID=UPI000B48C998|nr:diadenylate cyclase [Bacillus sp. JEM-1]
MNKLENIEGKMERLIKDYIEALNPTIMPSIETITITSKDDNNIVIPDRCIELGITEDSFLWEEGELNKLNNKLNEEIVTDSKIESSGDLTQIRFSNNDDEGSTPFSTFEELRYLNYIKIKENKFLLFYLVFTGFEDDTKDICLNNPLFSFLKYVMDYLFAMCKKQDLSEILDQNIDDSISSIGRDFINSLINHVCNENFSLYDEFNFISTLNYEGQSISAKLLLIDKKMIEKNVNFVIKFKDLIAFKEHRKIRKLLEMTDESIYLIGDNKHIYGLGNLKNLYNLEKGYTNKVLLIDFINRFEYKIKAIKVIHDIKVGETGKDEIVNWFYEECTLLSVKYGKMELVENTLSEIRLRQSLYNTFNKYLYKGESGDNLKVDEKITNIIDIVKCAYNQKHGTTLVITTPEVAETEVQRLKEQSIKIDVIDIKRNSYFKQVVEKITNIDGALYMDIDGYIHAIGVILDGYAKIGEGDSSRGARYNSAIRYKNGKGVNGKCVIVVISEDGMIDIIPDSEIEKQIKDLVREVKSAYDKKEYTKALSLVEKLEKLNPRRPETFLSKARILMRIDGAQENALEAINYAIQLREDYGDAYYLRGMVCYEKDMLVEARDDFYKAIQINPKSSGYISLGTVLRRLERYPDAIDAYSKAIELNKQSESGYIGRVRSYIQTEEYEKALKDMKTLINLDENNAGLYKVQGALYEKIDNIDKAIAAYKKALEGYKINVLNNYNADYEEDYESIVFLCERLMLYVDTDDVENEFQELFKEYNGKLENLKKDNKNHN